MSLLAPVLSKMEKAVLDSSLTLKEVQVSLWSILQDSSPGVDGFSASFSILAWEIVKEDLLDMAWKFFEGIPLSSFFGATNLVLILKVEVPVSYPQFRPISLCGVVYKILSKMLVNRLAPILDGIISPKQAAFVRGQSIFDNISIAQEMVSGLNRKTRGGKVVVKIYMAKAHDRVSWRFLIEVLKGLGFSEKCRAIIYNCVS